MDNKILLQNLTDSLAERSGMTRRKAEAFVRSFFEITEEALVKDGIAKVKGFGTTKIVSVSNRESVNINTGERFQIEGHDKISFTPDVTFRDLVNRPFAHFTTVILDDDIEEAALEIEEAPEVEEVPEVEEALEVEEAPETEEVPEVEEAPETEEAPEVEETLEVEETTEEEETTEADESETDADMQPIIINNNIPESNTTSRNWWKVAFAVLATLVLMTLSYFAGYYRLFCPCTLEAPVATNNTTVKTTQKPNDKQATPEKTAQELAAEKVAAEKAAAEKEAAEKAAAQKAEREAADRYQQMENGEYFITGVLEVHELQRGENLYRIAQKTYGDKELARYIIFHNNIENPDLICIGQKIEIPRLMRK